MLNEQRSYYTTHNIAELDIMFYGVILNFWIVLAESWRDESETTISVTNIKAIYDIIASLLILSPNSHKCINLHVTWQLVMFQ